MGSKPRLRVGLLLDSALKAFQAEIVDQIQSSAFAQLQLIVDDRGVSTSRLVRADHRRPPLLLQMYRRLDRRQFDGRANPLRATERPEVLQSIPTIVTRKSGSNLIA